MAWSCFLFSALLLAGTTLAAELLLPPPWPVLAVLAVALVLLAVNFRQLAKLVCWAGADLSTLPPDGPGGWGRAFAALHRRSRLAAEQRAQLTEALDRFRQAAQAMPDGVVILDHNLCIEWLNPRAEGHLGLEYQRDGGAPILNLLREPDFAAYVQGHDFSAPLSLRPVRNPGHTLQLQLVPFAEARTMLLVRDVTQIEKLETMRRDFVANVSHELRTPLTVVAGFIETLAESLPELTPEETNHYLALAGEQAQRMQRLIGDLLTLSALETDAPPAEEPVEVAALLADVKDEAQALSAGRHEIVMTLDGPVQVLGNSLELRSAFANLASNAVRYTPTGGRIEIGWRALPDGGGEYAVKDNGIGIEAKHIPRLTERFYRVDRGRSRETGGTGLGLAIVKHVLERHGARLAVDSVPGQGSTFSAVFPARRVV